MQSTIVAHTIIIKEILFNDTKVNSDHRIRSLFSYFQKNVAMVSRGSYLMSANIDLTALAAYCVFF